MINIYESGIFKIARPEAKSRMESTIGFLAPDVQPIPATDGERTHGVFYAEMVITPRSVCRSSIFQESD